MAMKVIGTGTPEMLTVFPQEPEIDVLGAVIERRIVEATEAAATAHERARDQAREDPWTPAVQSAHSDLYVVSRLEVALHAAVAQGERRALIAPREVLGPIVREAACDAGMQMAEALDRFGEMGQPAPDEMRRLLTTVVACTRTLIALDFVLNRNLDLS
jgi:hypothetical protein